MGWVSPAFSADALSPYYSQTGISTLWMALRLLKCLQRRTKKLTGPGFHLPGPAPQIVSPLASFTVAVRESGQKEQEAPEPEHREPSARELFPEPGPASSFC